MVGSAQSVLLSSSMYAHEFVSEQAAEFNCHCCVAVTRLAVC